MKIIDELLLEGSRIARRESIYYIKLVKKAYDEWKPIRRRRNAVDLSTTTANKLGKIPTSALDILPPITKKKLAILCMRVLDLSPWQTNLKHKAKIYKKIQHLLDPLRNEVVNPVFGSTLIQMVYTRFAANVCMNSDDVEFFVHFEPKMTRKYAKHIFSNETLPQRIFKSTTPELFPAELDDIMPYIEEKIEKAKAITKKK